MVEKLRNPDWPVVLLWGERSQDLDFTLYFSYYYFWLFVSSFIWTTKCNTLSVLQERLSENVWRYLNFKTISRFPISLWWPALNPSCQFNNYKHFCLTRSDEVLILINPALDWSAAAYCRPILPLTWLQPSVLILQNATHQPHLTRPFYEMKWYEELILDSLCRTYWSDLVYHPGSGTYHKPITFSLWHFHFCNCDSSLCNSLCFAALKSSTIFLLDYGWAWVDLTEWLTTLGLRYKSCLENLNLN